MEPCRLPHFAAPSMGDGTQLKLVYGGAGSALLSSVPQRGTSRSLGRRASRSLARTPARTAAAPPGACAPAGAAGAAGAAAAQMGTRSPRWPPSTSCRPVSPGNRPRHALLPEWLSSRHRYLYKKVLSPRDQGTIAIKTQTAHSHGIFVHAFSLFV